MCVCRGVGVCVCVCVCGKLKIGVESGSSLKGNLPAPGVTSGLEVVRRNFPFPQFRPPSRETYQLLDYLVAFKSNVSLLCMYLSNLYADKYIPLADSFTLYFFQRMY